MPERSCIDVAATGGWPSSPSRAVSVGNGWPGSGRRLRLAIVSTYPPRRCGLATFAGDLFTALAAVAPDVAAVVCAVDHGARMYPAEVHATIRAEDAADYRRAARQLHLLGVDAVLIQHEYGIFGGPDGSYVLGLADQLRRLGVPYLVTLHTVLSQPSPGQAATLAALCRHAAAVTVFTPTAVRLATMHGYAPAERITVVPHGAPEELMAPGEPVAQRPATAGALAEAAGRRVLSTFGLLSPGKGIDTAITAMAEVVRHHPDVRYLVAGATHPEHARVHGERHRDDLHRRVAALGLHDHVRFVDDFLTVGDLAALLRRTEIYLTPYHSRDQISSGTLTFALAAGCAAVSTDYHYARDMLTPDTLVPPGDPHALARAVDRLLASPHAMARARAAARRTGAQLSWPAVARNLAALLRRTVRQRPERAA